VKFHLSQFVLCDYYILLLEIRKMLRLALSGAVARAQAVSATPCALRTLTAKYHENVCYLKDP
jgi:hypothetical protein